MGKKSKTVHQCLNCEMAFCVDSFLWVHHTKRSFKICEPRKQVGRKKTVTNGTASFFEKCVHCVYAGEEKRISIKTILKCKHHDLLC